MADDEIVTEQIRQLTLNDRYNSTDKKATERDELMPAVDMRALDPAAGESADLITDRFRTLADADDDLGLETIILDEMDLMATTEFQRFAKPELPNFADADSDDGSK